MVTHELEKPTELTMWWPDPSAFDDLTIEDAEHGFDLSAPDGTECADWIAHWNQDEEHHKFFKEEFVKSIIEHAKRTLEQHGKDQDQHDQQSDHRGEAQDDVSGTVTEHEPGSDTESAQA